MKLPYLKFTFLILQLLAIQNVFAQIRLHTDDLPRFYQAMDSVLTTSDTIQQEAFIQRLYVDKASTGLREFMELRGGNTREWRKMINSNPKQLLEKRPFILSAINQEAAILRSIRRFKVLYPDFRDGDIYFCVGTNNSGGTIRDRTVYIGTEIAANSTPNWAEYLVVHEFAHTQQWTQRNITTLLKDEASTKYYLDTHKNLLGKCLEEGMADFVAELVLEERLSQRFTDGYMAFGEQNEREVWVQFKKDMLQDFDYSKGWLYAEKEIAGKRCRDLGYFVGYRICKSFYSKSKNKKQALSYMIGLNLTDENAKAFLDASGYGASW